VVVCKSRKLVPGPTARKSIVMLFVIRPLAPGNALNTTFSRLPAVLSIVPGWFKKFQTEELNITPVTFRIDASKNRLNPPPCVILEISDRSISTPSVNVSPSVTPGIGSIEMLDAFAKDAPENTIILNNILNLFILKLPYVVYLSQFSVINRYGAVPLGPGGRKNNIFIIPKSPEFTIPSPSKSAFASLVKNTAFNKPRSPELTIPSLSKSASQIFP